MGNTKTIEFAIFRDIWNLYMQNQGPEKDWDQILQAAREIERKYHNDKLCKDLLIAILADLDRKDMTYT